MGKNAGAEALADLGTLVGRIADDAKQLLGQQVELFRAEIGEELRRAGGAAGSLAAGGGLTAAGGLLGGFAAVHLVRRVTGLPLWACFGLVGGGLGAAGVRLLLAGQDGIVGLRQLPQTAETLGENVRWLANELNPASR